MATSIVITCQRESRLGTAVNTTDLFQGLYHLAGTHQGKPIYKKDCSESPSGSVTLYNWTDMQDQAFNGWWLGPSVGGREVWAFCPGEDAEPPEGGWRRTPDGVIDETMVVSKGSHLCEYKDERGKACLNRKPVFSPLCINAMCRIHCLQHDLLCPRHNTEWQMEQDAKNRAQRAPRRRGGKKARHDRDAYEKTCQ